MPIKSSICKAGIAHSLDGNIILFGGKRDGMRINEFISYGNCIMWLRLWDD